MEASYQRSPNRSYMILTGDEGESGYEQEMLRRNAVKLLLSFYMVELDEGMQVWYDITRLHSVRDIVKQEGVTLENLYMVLSSIARAFSMLSQYLISQKNILMDPDTVYFDREEPANVRLSYCPLVHDSFQEQLQRFFEFYMDEVDNKKEQVTRLVYRLYEMCQDPVTLDELVETVRKEMPADCQNEPMIEEFTPSEDRVISIKSEDIPPVSAAEEPSVEQPEIIRKNQKSGKTALRDRIKTYFGEKFPAFAKLIGKNKGNADKQQDEQKPHDFSQDFVFDPDTELQQKTVFMRTDSQDESEERKYEDHFEGLLVYDGENGETDYRIRTGNFRIGSQEGENEAVLHSRVVSRHHAMITRENGDFFIEDLNSTNGTYLNGKLLPYHDRVRLNRMDKIMFADVEYHIV